MDKKVCVMSGCKKKADRRLGRRFFCSDHYKEVKRHRLTHVYVERIMDPNQLGLRNFPFQIYRDTKVKIH